MPEPEIRLTLHGAMFPEQWNKLGTRLIPKLRSGEHDLSLNLDAGLTVGPQNVGHVETDLWQVLRDELVTGGHFKEGRLLEDSGE
jgi:hypothetical protein